MKSGQHAPDFTLPDQDGTPRSLAELLKGGPVVLFFYPAAMTKGCTAESCHFRDLGAAFTTAGAQRIGISTDPVAKQKQFADANEFDYPLLSDSSGETARAYGVKRRFGPLPPVRRTTFVIGTDGTIIDVIASELSMTKHADRALAAVRR